MPADPEYLCINGGGTYAAKLAEQHQSAPAALNTEIFIVALILVVTVIVWVLMWQVARERAR